MKKIIFSFILIGLNTIAIGQTPYKSTIKPPSPNAASLAKYGDIPVGKYTGTPNISVPIYTISDGDLSVGVGLNYHASGIKVSEEASQVGLGWALNAGGVISRNVVGLDDFSANRYFSNSNNIPINATPSTRLMEGSIVTGNSNVYGFYFVTPTIGDIQLVHQNGAFEYEPDQFSFNAGGITGKFIITRSKIIIQSQFQNIKIEMLESGTIGYPGQHISFKITAPDGTQYLFNSQETYIDSNDSSIKHISSWYLTKITSPTGKEANFAYSQATLTENFARGSVSETQFQNLFNTTCPSPNNTGIQYAPVSLTQTRFLDEITFANGKIKFIYSSRIDLPADKRLSSIEIYKNISTGTGTSLLKSYTLEQDYFTGSADPEGLVTNQTDDYIKRLKLLSVTERVGGLNLPAYLFEYFEGDLYTNLPSKTSYARDHWGYFNGQFNNTSLIPTFTPFQSFQTTRGLIGYISGLERNANPNFIKAFSLKKVTYPTGGFSEFEFEANDFDIVNSYHNDQTRVANSLFVDDLTITSTYPDAANPKGTTKSVNFNFNPVINDELNTTGKLTINGFLRYLSPKSCSGIYTNTLEKAYFRILRASDMQEMIKVDMMGTLGNKNCDAMNNSPGISIETEITMAPGEYILQTYGTAEVGYDIADLNADLHYEAFKGNITGAKEFGAGMRIARITHFDGTNSRIIKYTYTKTIDEIERSTGRLMILPQYCFLTQSSCSFKPCPNCPTITPYYNVLNRSSNSLVPINSSSSGNAIGYDEVTEWLGENGENGKILYQFENESETIPDYSFERPPFIASTAHLGNGQQLSETIYRNTGVANSLFAPVKESKNIYDNSILQRQWAVEFRPTQLQVPMAETLYPKRRGVFYQAITQQKNNLIKAKEIIFPSN